ncbi:hypothetical protein Tco_0736279 [Tanacetum coccineum]
MANLEFCDKHNMVSYLKKPTGSEGFQEIVDFLNGSHVRYALTMNPAIYVSLIEKFWQTATVKIVDNGEQEITVIVDGKEFFVTEASTSEPISNVPDEAAYEEWDDRVGRSTTTTASLDAAQASGNITKTQPTVIPNVPLSQEIGTGGSPRCQEAIGGSIAQTRSEKVKQLEQTIKTSQARRRAKIIVSEDEEDLEDSSKQGRKIDEIDQDPDITLVQHDAEIQGRHG